MINEIYDYREAGFRFFGLHGADANGRCECGNPDCNAILKHPIQSGWQHTPDWSDDQMEVWAELGHYKTGFGVLCAGWLVIDVDARNGGVESFKQLCKDIPEVGQAAFVVATGSGHGSSHHYFRMPERVAMVAKLDAYKGVDFKASGMVVGAGSLHASGLTYETERGGPQDITDAPPALVALLRKPERAHSDSCPRGGDIPEGERNGTLFRLAAALRGQTGLRSVEAIEAELQAINAARCKPPLDRDEVSKIARSAGKYQAGDGYQWSGGEATGDYEWARPGGAGPQASAGEGPQGANGTEAGQPPKPTLLVPVGELITDKRPAQWLIRQHIEQETLTLFFGVPKSGKSFVVIDWSACVATGTEWQGYKVRQGPVIYSAGEGHRGITRRAQAWEKHHGVSLKDAPLYFTRRAVPFLDTKAVGALEGEIDRLPEKPILIVIDTVARAFAGGDENSNQDAGRFVAACDRLKEKYRCAVILVHHSGHGDKGRARGASAFLGAVDHEFSVAVSESGHQLNGLTAKDSESPPPYPFQFVTVQLGYFDDEGEEVTSAVVVRREGSAAKEKPMTPALQFALKTLSEAIQERGENGAVHVDEWRPIFYKGHSGDSSGTKRQAFKRAREALLEKGVIAVEDDCYRVVGEYDWADNIAA